MLTKWTPLEVRLAKKIRPQGGLVRGSQSTVKGGGQSRPSAKYSIKQQSYQPHPTPIGGGPLYSYKSRMLIESYQILFEPLTTKKCY